MRIDTKVYGSVYMPDAGDAAIKAVDRRYGRQDFADAYHSLVELGKVADATGFDTFWYTEHHFQYEGYEVIPNQILLGAYISALTEKLKFGQLFNILAHWHPLKLAEDFAVADILSNGRMRFGAGRGTVPRETQTFDGTVASVDNGRDAAADELNRERFEESLLLVKNAWANDRFSHVGPHFTFPPAGIPDRGGEVADLTLVPNVLRPVEVYQSAASTRSAEFVARHGHISVHIGRHPESLLPRWEELTALAQAAGRDVKVGDEQELVVSVTVADTMEDAVALARPGHDEQINLLSVYGHYRGYRPPAGLDTTPADYRPTLEASIAEHTYLVGTPESVAEQLATVRDILGLQRIAIGFDAPSMSTSEVAEQMHRFSEQVAPLIGVDMAAGEGRAE